MADELYHGVKGMKWGVRRARKKYSNKSLRQYNANQRNAKSLKRDLDSNFDSSTGLKLDPETRSCGNRTTMASDEAGYFKHASEFHHGFRHQEPI